jgi:dihydroxyacetone kinase-like protein
MGLTSEQTVIFLRQLSEAITLHRDELTRLDAAIGDADHGTNLQRGFSAVVEKLPELADKDVGTILKTTGMTLISTVGGASGPLYGTAFIRAGMALVEGVDVDGAQIAAAAQAALEGIQTRGRAQRGEKTMVDAIAPAVDAFRAAIDRDETMLVATREAALAAETGMQATIQMQAAKGRASYLGERSIGHQDPGATSAHLIATVLLGMVQQATEVET